MHVSRSWRVLCMLGFVVASSCMEEAEFDGNYADDYDNEISQDQQEESPCQTTDFPRWDKLFIALEDSHMRQNMLLESLEQCCGGMVSLRAQVEKLTRGTCQQCVPSLESACRAQAERAGLRLQQGLAELRREGAEREGRFNATVQMLLHSSPKRLEEGSARRVAATPGPSGSRTGRQPTPRPGLGRGAAFVPGMKPLPLGLREQEVPPSLDMATMERALVAIATELQQVHLQLSRVIEQAGTSRRDRRDT